MYNHGPDKYLCPFCELVKGRETEHNKQEDIIYQDKETLAFISPKWWVNNPGHVIVIPKVHVENIYDISNDVLSNIYITAKKIAIALKSVYHSEGTSMRQHNESAGGQDIWHFHVHVFPRYKGDKLYQNHDNKRYVYQEEKEIYIKKLEKYFEKNLK